MIVMNLKTSGFTVNNGKRSWLTPLHEVVIDDESLYSLFPTIYLPSPSLHSVEHTFCE
jgi:hypothetical protein